MDEERPRSSGRALVDSTLDEHRSCMQVVSEVEACLDRHLVREGQWLPTLLEKLQQLARTLTAHFAGEQQGPMFRALPLSHPRLAGRLRKLEAEHARILEDVESVRSTAEEVASPGPRDLQEIAAQAQMLIAKIQRHEAEENEIVLEAHWSEVGTGD